MRFTRAILFALAVVLLASSTATLAQDYFPADFRGLPGSVYARWEFNNNSNPYYADQFNTVPLPGFDLHFIPPIVEITNMAYLDNPGGWVGLPGTSILNFAVPNFIDFEPQKDIWVQIGYYDFNNDGSFPFVAAVEAQDNEVGFILGELVGSLTSPEIGYRVESWKITPNPDFELVQVIVPTFVFVDVVIIDTISRVPEVSSLVMGAGVVSILSLGAYVRRRRRSA